MLYVTHDASEAETLCEEIILIERGKVVQRRAPL
jgi:ABC-type sugar transport system ATPase subunit